MASEASLFGTSAMSLTGRPEGASAPCFSLTSMFSRACTSAKLMSRKCSMTPHSQASGRKTAPSIGTLYRSEGYSGENGFARGVVRAIGWRKEQVCRVSCPIYTCDSIKYQTRNPLMQKNFWKDSVRRISRTVQLIRRN